MVGKTRTLGITSSTQTLSSFPSLSLSLPSFLPLRQLPPCLPLFLSHTPLARCALGALHVILLHFPIFIRFFFTRYNDDDNDDDQDVDETEVADKAEKGPLPKKKAEPKRTSRKEPVSRASEKGPKKKKTNNGKS